MVTYRRMHIEDEDAVFALRMATWGAPSLDYVREGAYQDPKHLDRTFVAFGEDGTLLSTTRYVVRQIRDAAGEPQKVGCVASVVTIDAARRQGHGHKLMGLTIEAMREEGCAWTLLFSSDMGVPLYLSLGYRNFPAHYYEGLLTGKRPTPNAAYRVERAESPFHFEDANWSAACDIYAIYNSRRPLSLVRDDAYWRGFLARRVAARARSRSVALFLARTSAGEPAGYLYADYATGERARQDPDFNKELDQFILIGELGLLPGHEQALPSLLAAMLDGKGPGLVGGSARMPREGGVYEAVRALFAPEVLTLDCFMMALPLAPGVSYENLVGIFAAPGALFWIMDDF
ncbi:MAG: GNAT family N-acetyltransferase [Chloroflexia bacterium]